MHSEHYHTGALALGASALTIGDVVRVARDSAPVQPLPESAPPGTDLTARLERIERSAAWVRQAMQEVERADAEGRPRAPSTA